MGDVFLIFQQPVDRWFVVHRFVDCFGGRLAIGFEQDLVIDFDFCHAGVEPDGNNDSQIIRFFLGDVPRSDRIQDSVGNPCLDRSHEDVGVFRVFDGHFADHQCDGSHLNITIQDGKHAGMSFGLVSQQIGDGISHGAIEFADDDFWFGGRVGRFGFDQCFTGSHHDPRQDGGRLFGGLVFSSFFLGHEMVSVFRVVCDAGSVFSEISTVTNGVGQRQFTKAEFGEPGLRRLQARKKRGGAAASMRCCSELSADAGKTRGPLAVVFLFSIESWPSIS